MGVDFLEAKAKRHRKAWDVAAVALRTHDLFTREPECAERNAIADVLPEKELREGEVLLVRLDDAGRVVALRGLEPVAVFPNPPAEMVEALRTCPERLAKGVVQQVNKISRTVSIRVGR